MFAFGCASSNDAPGVGASGAGGSGGSPTFGGGAGKGGSAGAPAGTSNGGGSGIGGGMASGGGAGTASGGAGTSAGASNGGSSAGMSGGGAGMANGGSGAGMSSGGASNGGSSAGMSSGGAGTSNGGSSAGMSSGGTGGMSGMGGTPTAGTTATGGTGGCVENLGCELSPPPSTGDIHQDCVDRINQFLTQCACLPPLARRTDGEACADQMAKYDADNNSPHAGVIDGICQPGGSQNSCPGYASNQQVIGLCMQQMWDEGPPPTSNCTGDCYQQHGHFINMTDPSVTRVACGFFTTTGGEVWAVQNFSR